MCYWVLLHIYDMCRFVIVPHLLSIKQAVQKRTPKKANLTLRLQKLTHTNLQAEASSSRFLGIVFLFRRLQRKNKKESVLIIIF